MLRLEVTSKMVLLFLIKKRSDFQDDFVIFN